MEIREAVQSDKDSIVGFQLAMARETENIGLDAEIVSAGAQAVFDDPTRGKYYVATDGDRVIASLLITYEWSEWRNGVVWWIQSVFVDTPFRGRGVYSRMYDHIRGLVTADPGITGIRLYVDISNKSAQQIYTRLGMNGEHYRVFEWMKS